MSKNFRESFELFDEGDWLDLHLTLSAGATALPPSRPEPTITRKGGANPMTRSQFLTVAAVFHGALGLAALIVPLTTAGLFGLTADAAAEPVIRLLGATLVGVAIAFAVARKAEPSLALCAVNYGGAAINLLSLIVVVMAIFDSQMASQAWAGAAVRALMRAGFAWFGIEGHRQRTAMA
ncbi:hypothetical protein GPROT1_02119 [Gammaproteobacteria bacterium]|nr:hypothetical protein GPROT1_02119 [Gammaproteobacteria bacterium]